MTLDDLIARLESAEEGSRELDADVAVATRSTLTTGDKDLPAWADKNFSEWRARSDGRVETVHTDGTGGLNWTPGAFTTSLDAVRTLYVVQPDYIPNDPLKACAEALKARKASENA